jgi:hypothetical protein
MMVRCLGLRLLVSAVVREMTMLGTFLFHHKPDPKTSWHPNQSGSEANSTQLKIHPSLYHKQMISRNK